MRETILVVDDSSLAREVTVMMLRDAGYAVLEASTGEEGLRLARGHPDLVVLDVHLPDVGGFEVCRRLRADPDTAAVSVLYLSGTFREVADRVRGLETGADGYLTKPVEAAELQATVRALLRLRQVESGLRESEARRQAAEALAEVGRLLTQSLDTIEVGQRIADSLRQLLRARVAMLYRLDPGSGHSLPLAVSGDMGPAFDPHVALPPGAGLVGLTIRECRLLMTPDILTDPRVNLPPPLRAQIEAAPYRAALTAPLIVRGQVIGALGAGDAAGRVFTDDEARLAESFADQAALAVENARLHEAAVTRVGELAALVDVSRTVTSTLDYREVAEAVLAATDRLLPGCAARLWERVSPDGTLRAVAVRGLLAPLEEAPRRPDSGKGLAAYAMEGQAPVVSVDLVDDARVRRREWVVAEGLISAVVLPLLHAGEAYGALSLFTRTRHVFPPEEIRLLELFAAQAAAAIANARLYHEMRDAYDELSRTKDQLTQAQKMEAVGQLAGGVAHDFNNLLTVIIGRSELLQAHLGADQKLRRHIDLLRQTAHRAADLTRQLLAFSRKQILQPRPLNLNTLVVGIEKMLRRLIGEPVDLQTVLAPDLGAVRADPGQIEQVLMNLVVNARDAMPQGGRVTIETANVDLSDAFVRRHPGARPGPFVMLGVVDTGVGMDQVTMKRLFEPFFTTKGPGKGTGLGLATVYGIVKQSEGYIAVDSAPDQGARFSVYLPRVAGTPAEGEPAPIRAEIPRGVETLLLVEDEAGLRDLAREVLEQQGYRVVAARHGPDAFGAAEGHAGPIHLLVTDVVMPHMSGRELAERLRPMHPEMAVLYMSGHTDDAIVQHGVLQPGTHFLQKPFTPDALVRSVRRVLDAARGPALRGPGSGATAPSANG